MIFLSHVEWPEMPLYKLLLTYYVWRIVWRPFLGHQAWSWTTQRRGDVFYYVYKRFLSRFFTFLTFFYFYYGRFFYICAILSGVTMGWLLRLVTGGPTGGRGPPTVLEFLVIILVFVWCYWVIVRLAHSSKFLLISASYLLFWMTLF